MKPATTPEQESEVQMKKVPVIRRQVETCPYCGAWDPFRKGPKGLSITDKRTGLRRIYGRCRACGCKLVLQYVHSVSNVPSVPSV